VTDVDLEAWSAGLEELHQRIARRFARAEPRERVLAYLRGLPAGLERKNGWTPAEFAGQVSPDGMQRLVRTAAWDADAVRDDLRQHVVDHPGEHTAVLIADDTGLHQEGDRPRPECSGGTRAPRAGPRTARSASSCATPPPGAGR